MFIKNSRVVVYLFLILVSLIFIILLGIFFNSLFESEKDTLSVKSDNVPVAYQIIKEGEMDVFLFENKKMSIGINEKGCVSLLKYTGNEQNFINKADPNYFTIATTAGGQYLPGVAAIKDSKLLIVFANTEVVTFKVDIKEDCIIFTVDEVRGTQNGSSDIIALDFGRFNLLSDEKQEVVTAGMALNLKTNASGLPAINNNLWAKGYSRLGIEGCSYAITIALNEDIQDNLKNMTVKYTEDIPYTKIAGAFASESEAVRGSYVFNLDGMTMDNVDSWIEMVKATGATQIDFHGGSSFRFGDCEPNRNIFPEGRKSLKLIIDKLHAAGLKAGLHTYAHFIDPNSYLVTPIPDKGLGVDKIFTLSLDIDENDKTIYLDESTEDLTTVFGFFVRNSVYMVIDDEIIKFNKVNKEAPYSIYECERGAYGTKISQHKKGAQVKHLKSCFGLFTPAPDTDLFYKVAELTAKTYNECGFDMIYLDALDGDDIFAGYEYAWYYGSKFVFEIVKRLDKEPILEMSTMHHHLWFVRSRLGAWDHPNRAHKNYIDQHNIANIKAKSTCFLPQNLGWWVYGKCDVNDPCQVTRMFMDDYEYLCRLSLANDYSLSFIGMNPQIYKDSDELKRIAALIKRYEDMRLGRILSEDELLSISNTESKLMLDNKFYPVNYNANTIELNKKETSYTSQFTVENPYSNHIPCLRIENLASTGEELSAIKIIDIDKDFDKLRVIKSLNVDASIEKVDVSEQNKDFDKAVMFKAIQNEEDIGYARYTIEYDEKTDISSKKAIGVWIYGDGKGEILNFQLKSPKYNISGVCDRLVKIDFVGWKYCILIENDAAKIGDYSWPYYSVGIPSETINKYYNFPNASGETKEYEWTDSMQDAGIYQVSRENVDFSNLHSTSVWINNMIKGESYSLIIGPVTAMSIEKGSLSNVTVTANGQELKIEGTIPSDSYLEYDGAEWFGFDGAGKNISDIKVLGNIPTFKSGKNNVKIETFYEGKAIKPRCKITFAFLSKENEN